MGRSGDRPVELPPPLLRRVQLVFPSGRLTLLLAVASAGSGFAEAGLLGVLARVAFSLSTGFPAGGISVGPLDLRIHLGDMLAICFGLLAVKVVLDTIVSYSAATLAARTIARQRNAAVSSFVRARWSVQSIEREGFLQELATTHAMRAANATVQATYGMAALLSFLALLTSAVVINPVAAMLIMVAAALLFLSLRPLSRVGKRFTHEQRKANLDYVARVAETSTMTNEIHTFGVADPLISDVARRAAAVSVPYRKATFLSRLIPNLYQAMALLLVVAALAVLYRAQVYGLASLNVVVLLLVRALLYTGNLQSAYHALVELGPYAEEMADRIERYQSNLPNAGTQRCDTIGTVAFHEVGYTYPDRHEPALVDISFEVQQGETVGIVGPSGAGKSTLVQILLRLRSPCAGSYMLNDLPAAEIAAADWTRMIAYVPQDSRLIEGTVADNIRYFRDIDVAEVQRAGRLAQIHDEVLSWPNEYQTPVGPAGRALSGGQRQRICLARALASRPEMLVLDEPTSALDVQSESLVQEALRSMKGSVTMFIVAHRLSTLSTCDRIMVLDDGRLAAFGPAEALMTESQYFSSSTNLSRYGLAVDSEIPDVTGERAGGRPSTA